MNDEDSGGTPGNTPGGTSRNSTVKNPEENAGRSIDELHDDDMHTMNDSPHGAFLGCLWCVSGFPGVPGVGFIVAALDCSRLCL
jgi:hypothetical protein